LKELETELMIEQIKDIYNYKIEIYKEENFKLEVYPKKESILLIISTLNNLIDYLYEYDLDFELAFIQDKHQFISMMLDIEVLFAKYLILNDRNYVLPLLKSKNEVISFLEEGGHVLKVENISFLKILSDFKVAFSKSLIGEEDNIEINKTYNNFLSMTFLILGIMAFNSNLLKILSMERDINDSF